MNLAKNVNVPGFLLDSSARKWPAALKSSEVVSQSTAVEMVSCRVATALESLVEEHTLYIDLNVKSIFQ